MIHKNRGLRAFTPGSVRLAALVLTALTLCAFLCARPVRAAEWMTPYLEQVQEWGVMRGDSSGNLHEDRNITRAEFVTLVNRAFGYTQVGPSPFTDVRPNDWFAEDISIAHQAGYFNGTTPTTASPYALVTREQAAVLLGRCLRFQGVTGAADTSFDDMHDIGGWSRGLVQEAADLGIIQGYADGTFRPKQPITRGQMACFLVRALGTLVQEPGEQTSGGVYGNLTITTPGVKLKDTTVTGNLYLTGGVGLGNVELENVNVLGKIILCGGGEAEKGEHSVILRNVTAGTLEVDSLAEQFLSVRAEGLTSIADTTIRTSAYLEDLTEDGLGLKTIRLDGIEGAQLQLAGNIKEVINLTPDSTLQLAQGVANVVTIDERADGASLSIDRDAFIRELNLDRGTPVTGEGSITHLNINAPGSNVSMLPDTIFVRPGITGNVNNVNMDNIAANESSEDPRLLAGYPTARNVAPTSAEAVFRTNKRGTIHWALTALMDGTLGEEELMNPSANSAKIIRSGTVNATASNTDFTARLTGLTREGSYYISAILVDARGRRSPVKVAAFTTPDDTAPNFASGYPQTPVLTTDADNEQIAQIMVMPTKDCQMYYVLLPRGATAPTAADFRSAALPGNLGFGIVTLRKNTPFLVSRINTSHLQEQTQYDLYLWLNDADNGKSSAVRRIQLTTRDLTPPTIQHLTIFDIAARQVRLTFALDEPGTLYFAVVKHGQTFYQSGITSPNDLQAKIQIRNGVGSLRRYNGVRVARAGVDGTITVSGLDPQTSYDLYYVAVDNSDNYCVYSASLTPPMQINTLDDQKPTVDREFENAVSPDNPYPNTDIRIVFSEPVVGYVTTGSQNSYTDDFLDAYQKVVNASNADKPARQREFAEMLKRHIVLYSDQTKQPVTDRTADNETSTTWTLDYRKATVYVDSTTNEMVVTFPYRASSAESAVNLASGETYYFMVSKIADTAKPTPNLMDHNDRSGFRLRNFTTVDAQLEFGPLSATTGTDTTGKKLNFHTGFTVKPIGTENVNDSVLWDLIIGSKARVAFEVYRRPAGSNSTWTQIARSDSTEALIAVDGQHPELSVSLSKALRPKTEDGAISFERLNSVNTTMEYGIVVTEWRGSRDEPTWSGKVEFTFTPISGDEVSLRSLANDTLTPANYNAYVTDGSVKEIGIPVHYPRVYPFPETQAPTFVNGYPHIFPNDDDVEITMVVSRNNCSYYCVIAEISQITPRLKNGTTVTDVATWNTLPKGGAGLESFTAPGNVSEPTNQWFTDGETYQEPIYTVKRGSCGQGEISFTLPEGSKQLSADTEYIAYFVLQGASPEATSDVYAFAFKTTKTFRPILNVSAADSSTGVVTTDRPSKVKWLLYVDNGIPRQLRETLGTYWNEEAEKTYSLTAAEAAKYKAMTVLQAMEEDHKQLGTIFDLFATAAIKEPLRTIFQNADRNGSTIMQVGNYTDDLTKTLDLQPYMSSGPQTYVLVAIANSTAGSGSEYAFAAASGLSYMESNVPQVRTISTYLSTGSNGQALTPMEKDYGTAINKGYTGTVTIVFGSDLYYYRGGSQAAQTVVDRPINDLLGTDYASTVSLVRPSPGLDVSIQHDLNAPSDRCSSVTLKFSNITPGTPIQFDSNLCTSLGIPTGSTLTISIDIQQNSQGYWQPRFNMNDPVWGTPQVLPNLG